MREIGAMRAGPVLSALSGPTPVIVGIGAMVGISFALAKVVAASGVPPVAALFWQLLCASIILLVALAVRGERLVLRPDHLRYYIVSGLLGVSGPQYVAYVVLAHLPAGLYTTLITLSPLATFAIASALDGRMLPGFRLVGIVIGLAGVSLATMGGFELPETGLAWVAVALAAPVLLACGNIYRNRAYPDGANPLALAAGMLLSQAVIFWPVVVYAGYEFSPFDLQSAAEAVVLIVGALTAVSYILTFAVQRRTDSVGFSQVGYFATLSGIVAGALAFGEPLSLLLAVSIAVLFLGLAVTNGHLRLPGRS